MVGTVPLDSLEDPEVPEVRKLALDRRRSSLKKVIANTRAFAPQCSQLIEVPMILSSSNVAWNHGAEHRIKQTSAPHLHVIDSG